MRAGMLAIGLFGGCGDGEREPDLVGVWAIGSAQDATAWEGTCVRDQEVEHHAAWEIAVYQTEENLVSVPADAPVDYAAIFAEIDPDALSGTHVSSEMDPDGSHMDTTTEMEMQRDGDVVSGLLVHTSQAIGADGRTGDPCREILPFEGIRMIGGVDLPLAEGPAGRWIFGAEEEAYCTGETCLPDEIVTIGTQASPADVSVSEDGAAAIHWGSSHFFGVAAGSILEVGYSYQTITPGGYRSKDGALVVFDAAAGAGTLARTWFDGAADEPPVNNLVSTQAFEAWRVVASPAR